MAYNSYHHSYHSEHGSWCQTPICPFDQEARVERLSHTLERIAMAMDGRMESGFQPNEGSTNDKCGPKPDWKLAKEALAFEGELYERTHS